MMRWREEQSVPCTFTAGEVAEFEYCPLAWWHEHYNPFVQAENEDLFAYLVDLEQEHDIHATALPEYQVIEQLLVRRGAFAEDQPQQADSAEDLALEQEGMNALSFDQRRLMVVVIVMLILALLLMTASFILTLG